MGWQQVEFSDYIGVFSALLLSPSNGFGRRMFQG